MQRWCQTASCHSCQPALWRCFHSALWASLTGLVHTSQARKSKAVSEYIQPCKAKLDAMGALEAIMFSGLSAWLDLFCLTSRQMQGLDSILVSYKRDQDRIIHISPKSSLDHCAHGHTGKKILLLIDKSLDLGLLQTSWPFCRILPLGIWRRERWGRKELRQERSFPCCWNILFSREGDSYLFTFDEANANHLFDGLGR